MKKLLKKLGFHFHDWNKWEMFNGEYQSVFMSSPRTATGQMRSCKTCNKVETEMV